MDAYSVGVRNSQGAEDGIVGTRQEINEWLRGWIDPEGLTVTVTDEHGRIVTSKGRGRKTIPWPAARGRPPARDPRKQRPVRWTEAEWSEVQRAAEEHGQTPSELVRRVVLAQCREG